MSDDTEIEQIDILEIEDNEYYWVFPSEAHEWEIGKAEKCHKMGFRSRSFTFACAESGRLEIENIKKIKHIKKPKGWAGK